MYIEAVVQRSCLTTATLLKWDSGTGVSCEFCKTSKNIFSYRTPSVTDSVFMILLVEKQSGKTFDHVNFYF